MAAAPVKYDYKEADWLVASWALRLFVLGAIVGYGLGHNYGGGGRAALIVGLLGGLFGASYGRGKGFELRLRAQEALCLFQTEVNTRAAVSAAMGA
jgi:hypothetical protein